MAVHPLLRKWAWFLAIWLGSVGALGLVALAIRSVIA